MARTVLVINKHSTLQYKEIIKIRLMTGKTIIT